MPTKNMMCLKSDVSVEFFDLTSLTVMSSKIDLSATNLVVHGIFKHRITENVYISVSNGSFLMINPAGAPFSTIFGPAMGSSAACRGLD
jgi:hypothetical protein